MKAISMWVVMFCMLISAQLISQDYGEMSSANIEAMSIPSSPAFSLLGVNPELVTRPSDVKEFKVDWRIKNYKVAPDLALEAQPLWWLHYRKKTPKAYLNISPFERILSTATFSLATAKIDNVNHLAYAYKFNIYKEYDPYIDFQNIKASEAKLEEQLVPIQKEIEKLQIEKSTVLQEDSIQVLEFQIQELRYQISELKKQNMLNFSEQCNRQIQENWNMDMIDIACGKVFKYDNTGLDSLNFEKAGYGIWINAAKGIGKNGLLTGILKMNKIGENRNYMLGAAYRIGTHRYNFFAELIRSKMNNVVDNGFDEEENFAALRSEDVGNGWYMFADGQESHTTWTLSYGGDFKLSNNILLNFALRTELKGDFSFQRFLPVANIICLMK